MTGLSALVVAQLCEAFEAVAAGDPELCDRLLAVLPEEAARAALSALVEIGGRPLRPPVERIMKCL